MSRRILRVQDHSGRGPFRPGVTARWASQKDATHLPPIYEEAPDFHQVIRRAFAQGLHVGCATREETFSLWFNDDEVCRLGLLGFYVVDASSQIVLCELKNQVLIASRAPFKFFKIVPWPVSRVVEQNEKYDGR